MRIPLFLLIPLFYGCLACTAQSFKVIHYSVENGLPSNEVYEAFQDRQGFVWFATDNGVVRFDGRDMQTFNAEHGLTDPVVFGFFEDHRGRLWFRTYNGTLSYYHHGQVHPYPYNSTLQPLVSPGFMSCIYVDSLDQVWFNTYRRGVWGKIDKTGVVDTASYQAIVFYNRMPFGHSFGGFSRSTNRDLINGKQVFVPPSNQSSAFPTFVTWRGETFMFRYTSVYKLKNDLFEKVFTGQHDVISLSVDKSDNLWVGYRGGGAEKIESTDFRNPKSLAFLKGLSVTEVIEDHEGGFWFSTLQKGVFYVPSMDIRNTQLPTGQNVHLVAHTKSQVFVGTPFATVVVMNSQGNIEDSLVFKPPLQCIYGDRLGNLWVSDNDGNTVLDSTLIKQYSVTTNGAKLVFNSAHEDRYHNMWLANGGWSIYIANYQNKTVQGKSAGSTFRKVFRDKSVVYLARANGLMKTDTMFSAVKNIDALSDYKINDIFAINDTTLLLTTIGRGFLLYSTLSDSLRRFALANKTFVANTVYDVEMEPDVIWMGTEKGLIRLDRHLLSRGRLKFHQLTASSGLISSQVRHLAISSNHIWAFSGTGFSMVDKHTNHFGATNPGFYVRQIEVNNKKADLDAARSFTYDQNNLAIDFGFIAFNGQDFFIRHRLQEGDSWSESSTARSLEFYSLAPGTYKLEIEQSVDNVHWTKAYTSPQIVINPPLWKRWYFQTGLGLLFLLMIFLFFRNQLVMYRRHQRKLVESEIQTLEKERSRIAKDLHDSVGTDFTAIKMMVSQELQKHNAESTQEIEKQFQHTLQEIKTIIYDLHPPGLSRYGLITGVSNYVNRLKGTTPIEIELTSFGPEIKDANITITVFRIVQELIMNSVKHSQAKNIYLALNSFDDLLNVVYEDNGKGFNPVAINQGLGLYNIESRLQTINGKLKFESGEFGVSYSIDVPLPKIYS